MRHLLIFLLVLLMSATKVDTTPRDFHVSIVGEEKVEQFESKFPQIVKDEAVYIAYLQRYYRGHEDEFINLMKLQWGSDGIGRQAWFRPKCLRACEFESHPPY